MHLLSYEACRDSEHTYVLILIKHSQAIFQYKLILIDLRCKWQSRDYFHIIYMRTYVYEFTKSCELSNNLFLCTNCVYYVLFNALPGVACSKLSFVLLPKVQLGAFFLINETSGRQLFGAIYNQHSIKKFWLFVVIGREIKTRN